jgi:hypothetical protein
MMFLASSRLLCKEIKMNGRYSRLAAAFLGIFIGISGIAAQEGFIQEISGTVEIKRGSSAWVPAAKGDAVLGDTLISTGFRSVAVLILGNSTLTVRPLTRLSVEEISRMAEDERVSLNLQTGRIRAEVTPPAGGRTEFTVRSPEATASVRGTIFEFDSVNLAVQEGTVVLAPSGSGNAVGGRVAAVAVSAGSESRIDETGRVETPREVEVAELRPVLPVGSDSGAPTIPEAAPSRGDLNLDLNWGEGDSAYSAH